MKIYADRIEDDSLQIIAEMLAQQRTMLNRCRALARLEGSLTSGKDYFGRPCLVHRFTDPLTGSKKSRKLSQNEEKLAERLKLSKLSQKMIPLLVYNIKQLEKLEGAYRSLDPEGIIEELPEVYHDIPCDLRAFGPDEPEAAPAEPGIGMPEKSKEKDT